MVRLLLCAALAGLCAVVQGQAGPNTLAQFNPSKRTQSNNATYCLVPIDKADAEALAGRPVLDIPTSILPSFPAGKHPLIVQAGYSIDIRMTALNLIPLQIPALTTGSILVPYVDVTGDGRTPINTPVNMYVGGTDGRDLQAIVPAIAAGVSPFEGTLTFPARFSPDTAAAQTLPDGYYSTQVKPFLLPNTISGPGVFAEAFDILFQLTDDSPYTQATFEALLNNPSRLLTGLCQDSVTYFNQTFTDPKMAIASVTLYHQILLTPPALIEGQYNDVYCFQANGVQVAGTGRPC